MHAIESRVEFKALMYESDSFVYAIKVYFRCIIVSGPWTES